MSQPAAPGGERHADARAGSTRRRPRRSRGSRRSTSVACIDPPLPPETPSRAPEQLGEQPDRVDALGEGVAVTAVVREHHVVRPQRRDRPDGDRLLPDRRVDRAGDLAGLVRAVGQPPRSGGSAPAARYSSTSSADRSAVVGAIAHDAGLRRAAGGGVRRRRCVVARARRGTRRARRPRSRSRGGRRAPRARGRAAAGSPQPPPPAEYCVTSVPGSSADHRALGAQARRRRPLVRRAGVEQVVGAAALVPALEAPRRHDRAVAEIESSASWSITR